MAIYYLPPEPVFPDPMHEDVDDLLAIGGDLRPRRLISAYQKGIFPWYSEDSPILWWSPDPRLVLEPGRLHVSKRLARTMRQGKFDLTVNMDFSGVITSCARVVRKGVRGTWIVPEMIRAYINLHQLGYAHSVEAWQDGRLVGGIYGVALGRAFFGESMFHLVRDASKVAMVRLVELLREYEFEFMDCQQTTSHLLRFGAREISRREFLQRLRAATGYPVPEGMWRPRPLSAQSA